MPIFFTMPLLWYQPWFDCNIHEQIVKILSHVLVKKTPFYFSALYLQSLFYFCNSSAGIGRTGTFIALDALHRQGVKKGKINIVEYVHTMREDRMNMIQNTVSRMQKKTIQIYFTVYKGGIYN